MSTIRACIRYWPGQPSTGLVAQGRSGAKAWTLLRTAQIEKCNTGKGPGGLVEPILGYFFLFGVDPKTQNLVWNRIPLPLWTLTQGATLVAEPGGPTEPVVSLGRRHVSDS